MDRTDKIMISSISVVVLASVVFLTRSCTRHINAQEKCNRDGGTLFSNLQNDYICVKNQEVLWKGVGSEYWMQEYELGGK